MNDPRLLLAALLDTVDQLGKILEEENKALARHHPEIVAQSVDRKLMLARTFERQIQQMGSFKLVLDTLPPEKRERVVDALRRFGKIASTNQTALEAAQRVTERVVTHIVEAVRKQNNFRSMPYSRPSMARSRHTPSPISVSLNQTF